MNDIPSLLPQLGKPFAPSEIDWRIQSSGISNSGKIWARVLAYLTNRAIMERLDNVLGAENWKNEYCPAPAGGILCGISIRIPFGTSFEWVTKWDGAANTDVSEGGKPDVDTNIKGGLSASMKRAAAQWGIGRYLYYLGESWAVITDDGEYKAKVKNPSGSDYTWFRWNPPNLPKWALPDIEDLEAMKAESRVEKKNPEPLPKAQPERPGNLLPVSKPELVFEPEPWPKEWNRRTLALSTIAASWTTEERDALGIKLLILKAKETPRILELAEARVVQYEKYRNTPLAGKAISEILELGDDIGKLLGLEVMGTPKPETPPLELV